MKRYAISDSRLIGGIGELPGWVERLDAAGVDLIQIREKALSTRALVELVTACVARRRKARVLVNGRVDVALSCRAHGVHLPGDSPSPEVWRTLVPPGFLFGVSCHTERDAVEAEREGADLIVVSPVFAPLSKVSYGPQLGLGGLQRIACAVSLPIYALGGVTVQNAAECVAAGADGIAGITLFR